MRIALPLLLTVAAATAAPAQSPTIRLDLADLAREAAELRLDGLTLNASLAGLRSQLSMVSLGTRAELAALADLSRLADLAYVAGPPSARDWQDPADSVYREARSSLNRGNWTKAAFLFARIYDEFPRSSYAPDAYYWQATALYRHGTPESLRSAREALTVQRTRFPEARTRSDATDLLGRVNAELARRGDEEAARSIGREVQELAERPARPARPARAENRAQASGRTRCGSDADEEKSGAMAALGQMEAERALPVLDKVMQRRDAASVCLRRQATFIISQHRGPEAEAMLLRAARTDPDGEVREQAVFWLGQAGGERAAVALDSILRQSDDRAIQDKAIFALSQNRSARARASLRDYATRSDAPVELRGNAIFWLGQGGRGEAVEFLRDLYRSLDRRELKEKVIFSVAQGGGDESARWLAGIAGNRSEALELRKNAIFWMSQSRAGSLPEMFELYNRLDEREIREQLIFAYSQRRERAAVDKLIDIARNDEDRELRKKALFWLSQSKDPRVASILEEILSKP